MNLLSTVKKLFLTGSVKSASISNERNNEMVKNYTEAQEARLASFTSIDNETAMELAVEFQKDVRSVRAKAVRMGIYVAKQKVSKTGGKIDSKEVIVADIAALVGRNLDGLEKASKHSLLAIRAKLAA